MKDLLDIARLRLANQYLIGKPAAQPAEVLERLCAIQAQDYAGAKWGVGQRCAASTDAALDALLAEGALLRTHVLRPTWHFVAPSDIRWLLALTGPHVHAANAPYYRKLGLDAALLRRSKSVIAANLRGGAQLTRSELAKELGCAGIEASGLTLSYLMMHAELEGLLCSGALRGKQHTYALLEERVPESPPLAREQALAELARRYFAGHGPALIKDLKWWSGLSVADSKAAVELAGNSLLSVVVAGRTYWYAPPLSRSKLPSPLIQLLPNYDEYLIAYREHDASFNTPLRVQGAPLTAALSHHILTRDGQVIGGWRRTGDKKGVTAMVTLLTKLGQDERGALEQQVTRLGSFVGLPASLSLQ